VGFLRYLFGGLRRHVAVSEDTVRRLDRLGYATDADLRFWRELWQQSESMFWGILRKTEEAAEEYRRWFPQLQAFAAECRRAVPAPTVGNLSAVEREQYRILLAKMEAFAGCVDRECAPGRRPNRAAIFSTTWIGLAAAQEVFGGTEAVILQEAERKRWFTEVYHVNDEAFWWYTIAWWTLREGLTNDHERIRQRHPIREGSSQWVVESGECWGTLFGGSRQELWRWDGQQAEFIEVCRVMMF
jgi:hypothetical protein